MINNNTSIPTYTENEIIFTHKLSQITNVILAIRGRFPSTFDDKGTETVVIEGMDSTPIPSSTPFTFIYPA